MTKLFGAPVPRRDLLGSIGRASLVLPFLQYLPSLAQGAGKPPARALFIYLPNGIGENGPFEDWVASGAGGAINLGAQTKPLESLKHKLLFPLGLSMRHDRGSFDTHMQGQPLFLAGGEVDDATTTISIDQRLAEAVGKTATPSLPSLTLGAQYGLHERYGKNPISTDSRRKKVEPQNDPWEAYSKVFGGTSLPAPMSPGAPAPDPALLLRERLRRSALQSVMTDIKELTPRLGAEDKATVENQLDTLRDMEKRLEAKLAEGDGGGAVDKPMPIECRAPTLENAGNRGAFLDDDRNLGKIIAMQLDIISSAFLCGHTRVATLQILTPFATNTWDFVPGGTGERHTLSHVQANREWTRRSFSTQTAYVMTMVANFLKKLDSVKEADGSTVLDNTIVFWGSEIGHGHSHDHMPFLMAGGGNLGFQQGKVVRVGGDRTPHTRLFLNFLQAFGVPDKAFGNNPVANSPLAEVMAKG